MVISKYKGPGSCYSTVYASQTRDQQRFTVLEVAADWDELMIYSEHIMWPSVACATNKKQLEL